MRSKNEIKNTIRLFLDNIYTKEDAEHFFHFLKDSENAALIEDISSELEKESALQKNNGTIRFEEYKKEAYQLLRRFEKKRNRFVRKAVYYAAMASVLFLTVYVLHYLKITDISSEKYVQTVTSYGEKSRLIFSDSTRAVLNSCSNITYPDKFNRNERCVRLSGEAFFEVSKDNTPFIVETGRFTIQVLGTAFNVKAYEEDELVSVAVDEGQVEISMPGATLVLKPREKVTLNARTGEIVKEILRNNRNSAAWINGWLYFDRTPIRDIGRELERIYGCPIEFKEGMEFDNLISGEHDNQSLESVLRSIEYTSGIKYKRKENGVLLYK